MLTRFVAAGIAGAGETGRTRYSIVDFNERRSTCGAGTQHRLEPETRSVYLRAD